MFHVLQYYDMPYINKESLQAERTINLSNIFALITITVVCGVSTACTMKVGQR